jgi:hypothetical protein
VLLRGNALTPAPLPEGEGIRSKNNIRPKQSLCKGGQLGFSWRAE